MRAMLSRAKSALDAKKRRAQRLRKLYFWKRQRQKARANRKRLRRLRIAQIRQRRKTARWRVKVRISKQRPYTKVHKTKRPRSYKNVHNIHKGGFHNYHTAGFIILPSSASQGWVRHEVIKLLWESGDKATICRPGRYYSCNV